MRENTARKTGGFTHWPLREIKNSEFKMQN
jgi:hypothetical protein